MNSQFNLSSIQIQTKNEQFKVQKNTSRATKLLILITTALLIQNHSGYTICAGEGLLSPINVSPPWKYESKRYFLISTLTIIEFKITYNFSIPSDVEVTKLQPGVIKVPGNWGTITYNGVIFQTYAIYAAGPSWHGLMNQRYAMEVQVKAREYYGKSITMCFFFETDTQETGFNSFLYAIGIGKGDIRKLEPGETIGITERHAPDITEMIGKQKEFLVYNGHSLVDDCEPTKYIFMLSSIYINYQQALELQRNIGDQPLVPVTSLNQIFQNFDPSKKPPKKSDELPPMTFHRQPPKPQKQLPPPPAYTPPTPINNSPIGHPRRPTKLPSQPYLPSSPGAPTYVHTAPPVKKGSNKPNFNGPLPPPPKTKTPLETNHPKVAPPLRRKKPQQPKVAPPKTRSPTQQKKPKSQKPGKKVPIVPVPKQKKPPHHAPVPPEVFYKPPHPKMITPAPIQGLPYVYNGVLKRPFGTMPNCAIPYYIKDGDFPGIKEWIEPPVAPKGYTYYVYYWCPIPGIKQPQDPNKVRYWPHFLLRKA